jgi:peptidoglycan-associated lipoprotein
MKKITSFLILTLLISSCSQDEKDRPKANIDEISFDETLIAPTNDEFLLTEDGLGEEYLTEEISADNMEGINVPSQEELIAVAGDRVFFATDSFSLDSEARAVLSRQASWLNQTPNVTITIEGHADERGTREYNLALGERRANSVRNFLVEQGVAPNRITVISYGKEFPEFLGSNPAAWAKNRRSVTVVN